MSWKNIFPEENRYFETENGILYCGDCLNIMKHFLKESIDLIVTDPPYLINYKTNHRKNKNHQFCKPIKNDDNYKLITEFIKYSYAILKNNKAFYCFTSWKTIDFFKQEIEKYYKLKNQIIWVKNNWTAGDLKAQYGQQYEIIMYANKGRAFFNGRRDADVWSFNRVNGKKQKHQNEKPLELIEYILKNIQMKWIGIELEEKYCEITKERILKGE